MSHALWMTASSHALEITLEENAPYLSTRPHLGIVSGLSFGLPRLEQDNGLKEEKSKLGHKEHCLKNTQPCRAPGQNNWAHGQWKMQCRAPGQIMVPLCHTMALLAKEKCPLPKNNSCMRPALQNTACTKAFDYSLRTCALH
jgi:hypothetical protein